MNLDPAQKVKNVELESNKNVNSEEQATVVPNQKNSDGTIFDLGIGGALASEEVISTEGCGSCLMCGDGGDDGN